MPTKIEKAQYYFDKAIKAYMAGDYKTAKNDYEKAIELNPSNAKAYNNLAIILTEHFQEYEKAKQNYEKAIELDSNYAEAYYNFALLLENNFQEYKKAKQFYEKAIELNPNYAEAYNNIALLLWQQFQEYQKAKQYYEKAIEVNPKFAEAYNNIAVLLWQQFQEYEKAKEYCEKAIKFKLNYAKAYNNFAILLTKHFQEHKKSKQYFEKAIKLNPKSAEAFNNFALLLTNHFKEHEKAKQYFEKAIEINPNFANAYNNLAFLLQNDFQEYEKAKYYFDKYILLANPKSVKKIRQITLKNYNQFTENLIIDLTYPAGHKKAGQPMEKVCFIGQSGTGKTSILELIKGLFINDKTKIPNANFQSVYLEYQFYDYETDISLINIPTDSVVNINRLNSKDILEYKSEKLSPIVDFETEDPKKHWYPILKNIAEYQIKAVKYSSELGYQITKYKNSKISLNNAIDKYNEKIGKLKEKNNSLENLNEFLKPIFSKFNIRIKTEPSDPEEIKFIPIENITFDKDNNEIITDIQTKFTSSGTKQILARTVPLFSLKPNNALILIDEPENSLYPNVQKEFIDFITQESWHSIKNIKNCQFFFATHSPTIASSFDPWEIIELKFNKTGKVEQKLYYEGERNVNNFTIYPKYLDIDSILMRVFDVSDDIYINREEKIDEFADYNIKIRKMEQKDLQNRPEYQELIIKRNELGKKLDWRT